MPSWFESAMFSCSPSASYLWWQSEPNMQMDNNGITNGSKGSHDTQHWESIWSGSNAWNGDGEPLRWHHNEGDGISNHQPHDCLLKHLFRRRSKETSKLHITGICAGNSLLTGEFPIQKANNAENVSIWWRLHVQTFYIKPCYIRRFCFQPPNK